MIYCSGCKRHLPVDSFYKGQLKRWPNSKSAKRRGCKQCAIKQQRKYRIAAKDKLRTYNRNRHLKLSYGLTLGAYQAMATVQGDTCAICKQPSIKRPLAVDHCHTTGSIRGLLCRSCNTGLGNFKDSKELLAKAIEYLSTHDRRPARAPNHGLVGQD